MLVLLIWNYSLICSPLFNSLFENHKIGTCFWHSPQDFRLLYNDCGRLLYNCVFHGEDGLPFSAAKLETATNVKAKQSTLTSGLAELSLFVSPEMPENRKIRPPGESKDYNEREKIIQPSKI